MGPRLGSNGVVKRRWYSVADKKSSIERSTLIFKCFAIPGYRKENRSVDIYELTCMKVSRTLSTSKNVLHVTAFAQWVAGGSSHSIRGRPGRRHPVWPRLGSILHENGRSVVQVILPYKVPEGSVLLRLRGKWLLCNPVNLRCCE